MSFDRRSLVQFALSLLALCLIPFARVCRAAEIENAVLVLAPMTPVVEADGLATLTDGPELYEVKLKAVSLVDGDEPFLWATGLSVEEAHARKISNFARGQLRYTVKDETVVLALGTVMMSQLRNGRRRGEHYEAEEAQFRLLNAPESLKFRFGR